MLVWNWEDDGMNLINDHPCGKHPLAISILSEDKKTNTGVPHRKLTDNEEHEAFLGYMVPALEQHHASPDKLVRRGELMRALRAPGICSQISPFPMSAITRKGNFAEVFLAEYLTQTTRANLPVYRLRYNPNPNQSMKGDDVLMFDLDSKPMRIIVGEAKFRGTPSNQAVIETVDGLVRSSKNCIPASLMFVADRLFDEKNDVLGEKVQNCAVQIAEGEIQIDYVGLLMGNENAAQNVDRSTPNELRNLLMISLGMQKPENLVHDAFERLVANP